MSSGSFYPPKKHYLVRNRETGEKYIKTVLKKGKKQVASSGGNNNASAATNTVPAGNNTVQKSSKQQGSVIAAQHSNATAESNRKGSTYKREMSMSPTGNMRFTEFRESWSSNSRAQAGTNGFFGFN